MLEKLTTSVDYGLTASAVARAHGPKFLRITDIQDDFVDWDSVPSCQATPQEEAACNLATGDIVFARTGATTGKSFLIASCPERSVFASYLIRVRPNKDVVDPRYLAWFFKTPDYWYQITARASGTAQPGVNASKLKALVVPVPPPLEQRRIADILDKADTIRRKRKEAITLAEELLRSAFSEMFGDPVTNPRGWTARRLGDVIERFDAGWSANGQPRQRVAGEYGVLKVSAVSSGDFRPEEHKAIPGASIDRELVTPRRGDLLFSRANTRDLVAACCLVESDYPDLFLPDKLWRIVPKANISTAPYLRFLFGHERFRAKLAKHASGTSGSMLNVSMEKVRVMTAPIPPLEDQHRFSDFVWRALATKRKLHASALMADELLSSLVQRAFRGNVAVSNYAPEPQLDLFAAEEA
jgi:type I restriction enzyme S subunit